MKLMKLDRRNAGFPRWKYALHFGRRIKDLSPRAKYALAFKEMYGPNEWLNPDRKAFDFSKPMWLYNDNWFVDATRGRIYFNNPSDLTFIELKMVKK